MKNRLKPGDICLVKDTWEIVEFQSYDSYWRCLHPDDDRDDIITSFRDILIEGKRIEINQLIKIGVL